MDVQIKDTSSILELVAKLRSATTQSNETVLLYFGASWCKPCTLFKPRLQAWVPRKHIVVLDVETHPLLATALDVRAVPRVVAVRLQGSSGRVLGACGVVEKEKLEELWAAWKRGEMVSG